VDTIRSNTGSRDCSLSTSFCLKTIKQGTQPSGDSPGAGRHDTHTHTHAHTNAHIHTRCTHKHTCTLTDTHTHSDTDAHTYKRTWGGGVLWKKLDWFCEGAPLLRRSQEVFDVKRDQRLIVVRLPSFRRSLNTSCVTSVPSEERTERCFNNEKEIPQKKIIYIFIYFYIPRLKCGSISAV